MDCQFVISGNRDRNPSDRDGNSSVVDLFKLTEKVVQQEVLRESDLTDLCKGSVILVGCVKIRGWS